MVESIQPSNDETLVIKGREYFSLIYFSVQNLKYRSRICWGTVRNSKRR